MILGGTVRRGQGPGGRKAPTTESEQATLWAQFYWGPSEGVYGMCLKLIPQMEAPCQAGHLSTHFHPSLVEGCPWGVKSLEFPGCSTYALHKKNPQALGNPQVEKQNHPLLGLSAAGECRAGSGDGDRVSEALRLHPLPPWK